MNRFLDVIQRLIVRQIFVLFLVGLTFFSFQVVNQGSAFLLANADTVKTPEGIYYKGTPDSGELRNNQGLGNVQKSLKDTADNVREKLNLNEDIPEATKEFIDSTQSKLKEGLEPLTKTQGGYYQENFPESRRLRDNI
jgi:hypothetical protein